MTEKKAVTDLDEAIQDDKKETETHFQLICMTDDYIWLPKETLHRSSVLRGWLQHRDHFKDKAYRIYCSYANLQAFGEYLGGLNNDLLKTNTVVANLCDVLLVDQEQKEAILLAKQLEVQRIEAEKKALIELLMIEAKLEKGWKEDYWQHDRFVKVITNPNIIAGLKQHYGSFGKKIESSYIEGEYKACYSLCYLTDRWIYVYIRTNTNNYALYKKDKN